MKEMVPQALQTAVIAPISTNIFITIRDFRELFIIMLHKLVNVNPLRKATKMKQARPRIRG